MASESDVRLLPAFKRSAAPLPAVLAAFWTTLAICRGLVRFSGAFLLRVGPRCISLLSLILVFFFRGRRQGREPLNQMLFVPGHFLKKHLGKSVASIGAIIESICGGLSCIFVCLCSSSDKITQLTQRIKIPKKCGTGKA